MLVKTVEKKQKNRTERAIDFKGTVQTVFETEGLISTESLERVEAEVLSPEQSRDRISLQKTAYFLVYQLTS